MMAVYAICAVVGGTLFLCQFVMSLLGLAGGDHDMGDTGGGEGFDHDHAGGASAGDHSTDAHGQDHTTSHAAAAHGSSWFFGVLTFRTIVAALTFFGLAGLAGSAGSLPATGAFAIAMASGIAAMYAVSTLMRGLTRLSVEGTVQIEEAVGQTGTVYLRVPGFGSGVGKVTLTVQNRTMEYSAITNGEELPTGTAVIIVGVADPDTVEIRAAPESV